MDDLFSSLPHLLKFRPLLYGILMWIICFYAFLRGGWEERISIIVKIFGAYVTFVSIYFFDVRYRQFATPVFCIDIAVFLAMQWIALWSRKFWPMWMCALSGIVLISHLAPLLPFLYAHPYYDATALWSYPSLFVITLGVAGHHKARARSKITQS